ncbi:MAG: GAF domain-containing protein [Pseudomonadota bacterium]
MIEPRDLLDRVRRAVRRAGAGREEKLEALCGLLRDSARHYDWVGFYIADETKRQLVLGPYAGEPTDHLRIGYGSGICGRAADTKKTFVVQDVTREANYLSCSPSVKAEIVVPVMKQGRFVAELDIDSHTLRPFSDEERKVLEQVCEIVSELF